MAHLPERDEVQIPQSTEDSDLPDRELKGASEEEWQAVIHRFHMTARKAGLEGVTPPEKPLIPVLLMELEKAGHLHQEYPFYLSDTDSKPFVELLKTVTKQCEAKGEDLRIVGENVQAIANFLNRPENASLLELSPELIPRLKSVFDLSPSGEESLARELSCLAAELSGEGDLVRLNSATLLKLFAWACRQECLSYRLDFVKEVKRVLNGLNSLLLVDRQKSPQGRSPEYLAAGIGEQGSLFVSPAALSTSIPEPIGPIGLTAERRERIEKARETLSDFLSTSADEPPFYLIHSDPLEESIEFSGAKTIQGSDSFSAALEFYESLLLKMVNTFKALRVGRLEISGDYDPDLHDALLEDFDWRSCEGDELRAIAPVVIYESEENVFGAGLTSLSKVLRSGLPLRILIIRANLTSERELSRLLPDLSHLLIAHRECLVVQSALARPSHLLEGLRTLLSSLRSGVVVATGTGELADLEWSWPEAVLAHLSRSAPAFTYDPEAGTSWAERFALQMEGELEEPWIQVKWAFKSADDSEDWKDEVLTFAHAAALNTSFRKHFLLVPQEAWNDEQLEIGTYLDSYQDGPPQAIPFIWVFGDDEVPTRAIVTRELVNATRDRQRSWRMIQEFAGVNSEYVKRAVEVTRTEVESSARAEIEAIGEQERAEGAAQAIERLVEIFTHPDSWAATSAPAGPLGVESAQQPLVKEPAEEVATLAQAVVEEGEEEEEFSAEPYIDTFLCTSCNDCINLNPLLFKYNQEKQAVIGDVSAGTFLELVKAAEACPAKCIHPGSPANNDETATPEVIARAKAFQ